MYTGLLSLPFNKHKGSIYLLGIHSGLFVSLKRHKYRLVAHVLIAIFPFL